MSINALKSEVLTLICFNLHDSDAKALGTTSHKMNKVVQGELKRRDESLEQLLSSFEVLRKWNVQPLKELNMFCLGELHYQAELNAEQLELIRFLASRGPCVVLLESWDAMKILTKEEISKLILDKSWHSMPRENVYFVGWDDYSEVKRLEAENTRQYEDKLRQIDRDCSSMTEKMTSEEDVRKVSVHKQIKMGECAIEKIVREWKADQQTFPGRVKAMGKTLKNIDHILADLHLCQATFVLIAGGVHLQMHEEDVNNSESPWNLSYFYEQLEPYKAAILFSTKMMPLFQKHQENFSKFRRSIPELERKLQQFREFSF